MSWFLYRFSRWSFRHRWTVVSLWLAALIALGIGASTLSGPTNDEFSMKGMESTEALALIKERAPSSGVDGASATIIFQAPEGKTLSAYADKINADLAALKTDQVASVVSPLQGGTLAPNGRAGLANVSYTAQYPDITEASRSALASVVSSGESDGLLVAVNSEILTEGFESGGVTEGIGVVVALIVLVLTLGTLLAAGMSMITALIGVAIGVLAITTATGFINLGSTTPTLATMLGLAVGIDYALFIFTRYRHELAIGRTPEEAAGRAVGTAGTAVVFAGTTVVIALVGLSVVQIRFLTEMGVAAAFTVVIAVLIAISLLPAVFGIVGARVLESRIGFLRRMRDAEGDKESFGFRYARALTKHRWFTFVIGVVAAVVLIIPALSMQLAVPDNATAPSGSQSRIAYDLVADNFGPGANGPLLVVVDTTNATDKVAAVNGVNAAVQAVKGDVASVVPAGPAADTAEAKAMFEQQLQAVNFATITVIPRSGPSDADTQKLVSTLRHDLKSVAAQTNTDVYVSGQTAVGVDISKELSDAFPRYLVVVVGLAFVLLVMVFRSILVPLKAVLGFLLSIGMALGVTVAITQWGWLADVFGIDRPSPIMFMLPILLTGILFGLAMDYELFLVSRMREEYVHGKPARDAIVAGFGHSARVVTAAALIMVSVFGSFAMLPEQIIKTIGFGLAFGLLADAFLVRMTLVPAFMAIFGERMWWIPSWLDRVLPRFDIEGEELTKRLDTRSGISESQ